jgi:hypothetical protein
MKRRLSSRLRPGFRIDEIMEGYHEFLPEMGEPGRRTFRFDVTWGAEDLAGAAARLGRRTVCTLRGRVTAEGICRDAPCEGVLVLDYRGSHTIRYEFTFAVDEVHYRYVGEKVNIRLWNLPVSHTTCFGTLVRAGDGALVSRGVSFFRLRALPAFVRSFSLTLASAS